MLISSTLSVTNACSLVWDRAVNTVALLWDGANGSHAKPIGSSATIQNSQCALGVPTLTTSGTSIILSLPLSFKGPFTGPKNIYMYGVGPNGNTGWIQRGTYSVFAGGVPVANSVTPPSGSGTGQSFTFTISDQGGSNFLLAAAMLFTPSPGFTLNNSCYIVYNRDVNQFSLVYDALNGSSTFNVGYTGSASNSQCTLYGPGTFATIGATSITITVNVAFKTAFAGAKSTYLYAAEFGFNSGWVQVGGWAVPGTPPTVNSISPSAGSGLNQNFTASVSTDVAPSDLTRIRVLVSPNSGTANACYVEYNRTAGTIGLYDNAGTVVSTKPLGSSATLQNSQCAIGYSVASLAGGTVTITVQIVFKSPAFSGAKTLFVEGINTYGTSSLINKGTWTVP
jgi:hypothetical protein